MKQAGIIIVLFVIAGFAILNWTWPSLAAPTVNVITVTTTTDNMDAFDQQCSLREALHNANNNDQFSPVINECPAGSGTETDVIVLVSGETYDLVIAGSGDDEGDLDVLSNGLSLDLRLETDDATPATINMTVVGARVMEIHGAAVTIDNVTLSGGDTADFGGGIFNEAGTLTLINTALQNNDANAGGGLYNNNGTVLVSESTMIILNMGALGGGGIFNNGVLTVTNSIIRANESGASGGGIYNGGGALLVQEGSMVNLNTAVNDGGGIYLTDDTVSAHIHHSTLEGNQAANDGGGVFFDSFSYDKLLIEHAVMRNNTADQNGGGVHGSARINYSQIDNNHAGNVGGGLYAHSVFHLHDVTAHNNTASLGGGIGGGAVYATQLIVAENEATGIGGGLYVSYVDLQDTQVISNTAGGDGGGLYANDSIYNSSAAHLERVLVANNSAANGGGIWTERRMTLANVTISSNGAQVNGGGLYIDASGIVTATNITLAVNMPGIDLYKMGQLTLQNSIISNLEQPNCITSLDFPLINSLGNNLSDDDSCLGLDEPTDIVDPDTLLGPLADNGGGTLTHALLDGSPAVDAGDAAACAGPLVNGVDQRGVQRPLGAGCDMGAYEKGVVIFLPVIMR